jgi:hypothetical protein
MDLVVLELTIIWFKILVYMFSLSTVTRIRKFFYFSKVKNDHGDSVVRQFLQCNWQSGSVSTLIRSHKINTIMRVMPKRVSRPYTTRNIIS